MSASEPGDDDITTQDSISFEEMLAPERGDGRLEWVDGGLVRDIGAVAKDIDLKISAYLAARGGQAKQQESDQ